MMKIAKYAPLNFQQLPEVSASVLVELPLAELAVLVSMACPGHPPRGSLIPASPLRRQLASFLAPVEGHLVDWVYHP